MTPLRRLLDTATATLAAAGVPSPRHDAEALAAHVLGLRRSQLAQRDGLAAADECTYHSLVRRRAAREPLQHLTGTAAFRHLEIAVGPGVFVPRPETEVLAGWVIDAVRALRAPVVVDLCAGSGAVALAVAAEVPAARVHAVEVDPAAHAWAARNIERCGLADRVRLHLADASEALGELDATVDAVASNPPYIPLGSDPIDPEVRDHDPPLALWSGGDGLAMVRVVAGAAVRLLRPGGVLAVEHADSQGETVPRLLREAGLWTDVRDHQDLAGRPRFTTARRGGGQP